MKIGNIGIRYVEDNNLGLEKTPLKVLLDTTVIQNLLTFGEYVFDNYLSNKLNKKLGKLPIKMQDDIHALRNIFGPATRSPVVPLISTLSLNELSLTGNKQKRDVLLQWGFDLLEYSIDVRESNVGSLTPQQTLLSDFLPDKIDRLLIGEYKRTKCHAFITMDYKTILKFRSRLKKEHVNVLSPSEWWVLLEPLWSLWV